MKYLRKVMYTVDGKNLFATIKCNCENQLHLQGINDKSFFYQFNKNPKYIECNSCNKQTPYQFIENVGVLYWLTIDKELNVCIGNSNVQYIINKGIETINTLSIKEIKSKIWQFTNCEYEQLDDVLKNLSFETLALLIGLEKELYIYE